MKKQPKASKAKIVKSPKPITPAGLGNVVGGFTASPATGPKEGWSNHNETLRRVKR